MTFESNKTMGGIGALLMAIGTLPLVGVFSGILALVGLILVLIAMKGLADNYADPSIFTNVLYAIVMAIIGIAGFVVIIVTAAASLLSRLGFHLSNWSDWAILQKIQWNSLLTPETIWPYIAVAISAFVLLFIFMVIAAFYLRRSLNALSLRTRIGLFTTAGALALVGAMLTIVVIGFILLWVALLLLMISFFSINTEAPPVTAPTSSSPQKQ